MVELLYAAGLRVSELINLQLENVNLNEGWVLALGKGGKQRFVPLHPTCCLRLKYYLSVREAHFAAKTDIGSELFLNNRGKKSAASAYGKNWPHWATRRAFPAAAPAFIPPHIRQPPAAGRGGFAQSAGNAGAFQPGHHPNLHAFGRQRPEKPSIKNTIHGDKKSPVSGAIF